MTWTTPSELRLQVQKLWVRDSSLRKRKMQAYREKKGRLALLERAQP